MLRAACIAVIATLMAAPLGAAPSGGGLLAGKPAVGAAAGNEAQAQSEANRRREMDELARQDLATVLRGQFGIDVDWRASSIEKLWDIRLRVTKAIELQTKYGVTVDWRRYSWDQLESMRRSIVRFETKGRGKDSLAPFGSARVTSGKVVAGDSDALIRPTFSGRVESAGTRRTRDIDDVIRPTFAARRPTAGRRGDPDALLLPTFTPLPRPRPSAVRFPSDPDALIDIALSAR